jgi:hypothetical protein
VCDVTVGVAIESALPAKVELSAADVDVEHYGPLSSLYEETYWAHSYQDREKQAQDVIKAVGEGHTGEREALARQLLARAHKFYSAVP